MLKTPKEILEEMKEHFKDTKIEWEKHVSNEEENPLLALHEEKDDSQEQTEEGDSEVTKHIKEVLGWMNEAVTEALKENKIEIWKKFYKNWNGNSDYKSKDKYNGDKDLAWQLSDLQDFLIEWEMSSQQELIKKLQNLLRTAGINPDDENALGKAEGLKKVQDDLDELGIDKSKVKEMIEWLVDNYIGEEIKIKAQMEVKENLNLI